MARTSIFHHRRGQDTLFAQRTWYMIQPLDRPGIGLYAGMGRDNPIVHMAPNAYSSQNWQLFPQAGRYFIRNWDWHSPFQLGISADRNQSVLAMLPRSGSLSQQWIVNKVDGGYELLNGLLGNATKLLAESDFVAVMKSGESGIWNITRNESAEQAGPKEKEMYDEVAEFQVAQPTLSSSASDRPLSQTSSSSIQSTLTSTLPSRPPTTNLSKGGIAGIVSGAIAGMILLFIVVVLFMRRKKYTQRNVYEKSADPATTQRAESYAYCNELEVPPTELATSRETVELDSKRAK